MDQNPGWNHGALDPTRKATQWFWPAPWDLVPDVLECFSHSGTRKRLPLTPGIQSHEYSKSGVLNSKLYTGLIEMEIVSVGRRINWKKVLRVAFGRQKSRSTAYVICQINSKMDDLNSTWYWNEKNNSKKCKHYHCSICNFSIYERGSMFETAVLNDLFKTRHPLFGQPLNFIVMFSNVLLVLNTTVSRNNSELKYHPRLRRVLKRRYAGYDRSFFNCLY